MRYKMKKQFLFLGTIIFFISVYLPLVCKAQLKAVIYDFEGLDIGQVDLPEGDYRQYDLQTFVSSNPLGESQMLGQQVLRLDLNWKIGKGVFGKGISKFIELNAKEDYFNFYIYNPIINSSNANIQISITEDDNKNNIWEDKYDDRWKKTVSISPSEKWQLISIPIKDFVDNNLGGNGVFDAAFSNQAGKIFNIQFNFLQNLNIDVSARFYLDMICFSEGVLPTGNSILNYPNSIQHGKCLLGSFNSNSDPQNTAAVVEGLFPYDSLKKLKYIHYFIPFSDDGNTFANKLPGQEVPQILKNGYTPIITWEPLYSHLDRLNSSQPKLNDFVLGKFNSYIDAFGDKLKSFNDTIIIRFMHEFEGDWYPWALANNNQDPTLFINVFRNVVDRIKARGAHKIKWMWCINGATYHPVMSYNWVVGAYPGDAYVDIVACEAYNLSITGTPPWRSFRAAFAEPYYYLRKYFPQKPLFICETGCRERDVTENPTSQTKAKWIEQMDKEIQSNFRDINALILFNKKKSQDYTINSSPQSLSSFESNVWNDDYYFKNPTLAEIKGNLKMEVWNNVLGSNISYIPVNSSPSSISLLNKFEAPRDVGDNFGRRISGYIYPPFNGNYVFWISGNNKCDLFLSKDEQALNKSKIAWVSDWTNYREINKYSSQQSVPVYLQAGKKYYVEALHKEELLGDHISVGWKIPGDIFEMPIPGNRLSTMIPSNGLNYYVHNYNSENQVLNNKYSDDTSAVFNSVSSINIKQIDEISELKIFPNPNNGNFTLKACFLNLQQSIQMTFFDPLGKVIQQKMISSSNGCISEIIHLTENSQIGLYILTLKIGDKEQSIRVLISNN